MPGRGWGMTNFGDRTGFRVCPRAKVLKSGAPIIYNQQMIGGGVGCDCEAAACFLCTPLTLVDAVISRIY
jgi:hypothetical protein